MRVWLPARQLSIHEKPGPVYYLRVWIVAPYPAVHEALLASRVGDTELEKL